MWDFGAQGKLIAKVGISTPVQFASFSPDGKRILVAGGRTAQIFDAVLRNGTLLNLERDDAIKQAQFSPDGKHLVVALFAPVSSNLRLNGGPQSGSTESTWGRSNTPPLAATAGGS